MRIVCLLLLISSCLRSQEKSIFTLKPGIGINGCQIHGDNYSGYDKFGLFGGIAVNARLNKRASLELGLYFSQKGARHNPNPPKDYSYYRVHLNYLDLPLSWRFLLNDKYFMTLGPSVAYLISYKEETELGDWTGDYPFNKFEAGVNIGLGRKINDQFTVELRCSNSITPVRDYGVLANQVYYPNPIARFFNKGLYSNVLTFFVSYKPRIYKNDREH